MDSTTYRQGFSPNTEIKSKQLPCGTVTRVPTRPHIEALRTEGDLPQYEAKTKVAKCKYLERDGQHAIFTATDTRT